MHQHSQATIVGPNHPTPTRNEWQEGSERAEVLPCGLMAEADRLKHLTEEPLFPVLGQPADGIQQRSKRRGRLT